MASWSIHRQVVVRIFTNALILPALLLAAGCSRAQRENSPVPPKEVQANDQIRVPDTPEGQGVLNHINAVYSVGADAEANYQASLNVLRSKMNESVSILVNAYNEVDKPFYSDRWVLVQTLADLRGLEALDGLTKIANEPLPEKGGPLYGHEISAYKEESTIRITAITGIANLAVGDDDAARILTTFFNHSDSTIRLAAMNALAQAIREADDRRKRTLLQLLPKDFVFVPDLTGIEPPGISGADPNLRPRGRGKGPAPTRPQ